jgi:hypothetical protein
MTSRTLATVSLVAAGVLALAGCAHPGRNTPGDQQNQATAGLGAIDASPSPSDTTSTSDTGNGNGSGSGNGTGYGNGSGGGHHTSPTPSTNPSGPRIVTFTATGAVCPSQPQGQPYSNPGSVTVSWKIANADTVEMYMDGGLWKSYPGTEGSDTLNFQCSLQPPRQKVTHTYLLVIKNTSVKKTVSASAYSNPS